MGIVTKLAWPIISVKHWMDIPKSLRWNLNDQAKVHDGYHTKMNTSVPFALLPVSEKRANSKHRYILWSDEISGER
jgi:hypothetical protein